MVGQMVETLPDLLFNVARLVEHVILPKCRITASALFEHLEVMSQNLRCVCDDFRQRQLDE
jgi:hypothetical protein